MESSDQRAPVVLHNIPVLPEAELKELLLQGLSEAALTSQNILLRRKEDRYQAFLMVPSDRLETICVRKELQLAGQTVYIRKWHDFQVFVGRLPEGAALQEVKASLEGHFGKIARYEQVLPHEGSKNKFRHLYLQFERAEDAEKCLFSNVKLSAKNYELRVARAYGFGENEETDKKIFIKVVTTPENAEEMETTISNYFRREGQLREKVRLENGKGTVTYTSAEVADGVLKTFKGNRIGDWDVIIRPFANYKDNFTVFMANINPGLNEVQLQQILHEYEPVISCKLQSSNSRIINATVTFGTEQAYKRILADFKTNQNLRAAFASAPYITFHMNARQRSQYNNFRRGANDKKKGPNQQERPFRPVVFPNEPFMMPPPPPQFGFGFPPQGMPKMNSNMNMGMPLPGAYRK